MKTKTIYIKDYERLNLTEFPNFSKTGSADELTCSITHSWRYYFATSTTVNLDTYDTSIPDSLSSVIEKDIENERERLGNEFYKELEEEYFYQTSKDAIIETIEANEYEFLENGSLNCYH